MLNDIMAQLQGANVFNPLGANQMLRNPSAAPLPAPPMPQLAADPTMSAPVDPRMQAAAGQARPNFGSYIPQGLVQMLMQMQTQRPEIFQQMLGGNMGQRSGLTPGTDLGAGYPTRPIGMANAAGLAPMPDFTGGVGNQAPNAQGNIQRPMGMAERKAPNAAASGY